MKKVLIIEDEEDMVYALTAQLGADGYNVIAAADGVEGLKKAFKEKPDLILLDIMMPKKDGYTFLLDFKKNKAVKSIPVIVLTAKGAMKDMFELEGVKAYITKPFESTELLSKIKEIIG